MAAGTISRLSSAAPSLARRFFGVSVTRRAFGSASAARLDDDYYSDCEEEEEWNRSELVDAVGWVPPRGVQWVVIGDRGTKKNVYAQRLSKLLDVPHISMGTLLRHELNPGSSIYKKIANAVSEGKLVPEDIIFSLLSKRLEEGYNRGESGFILDGIPRSRLQAEILDQIADVDLVVNLKSEELVQRKNLATGNLNLLSEISDSKELYNQNLVHTKQSQALEDYYRKQRKIIDFEVTGQPSDTWQGLLTVLRLQHINAISSSSQKLTA